MTDHDLRNLQAALGQSAERGYGDDGPEAVIDDAVRPFNATMTEDQAVLAGLLRGMASRSHARGPLAGADFEGPVRDFHRYYNRRPGGLIASPP
jgi:hypothetical protein